MRHLKVIGFMLVICVNYFFLRGDLLQYVKKCRLLHSAIGRTHAEKY